MRVDLLTLAVTWSGGSGFVLGSSGFFVFFESNMKYELCKRRPRVKIN